MGALTTQELHNHQAVTDYSLLIKIERNHRVEIHVEWSKKP